MLRVIDRLLTRNGLCITVQGRQNVKIGTVLIDCKGDFVRVRGVGMGGDLNDTDLLVDNTGLNIEDKLFETVGEEKP